MPKNSSLTSGQLFLLFCLLATGPPFLAGADQATWVPFLPMVHLYVCFSIALLVHCLRRFFIPPSKRLAVTWFDLVFLLLLLLALYDVYVDSSVITYGELLWRATTLVGLLVVHCGINKIPLFSAKQPRSSELPSSSPRPTGLIYVLGLVFRTAKNSSTDQDQAGQPKPMDNKTVPRSSWRFWVLVAILLSAYPYALVVQQLDLNPVAVLTSKGASISITGPFGSVDYIASGSDLRDADLIQLGRVTCLKELELTGEDITDAGLVCLEGLSSLEVLRLRQTQVTEDGAVKLKKALPNCRIELWRPRYKVKIF